MLTQKHKHRPREVKRIIFFFHIHHVIWKWSDESARPDGVFAIGYELQTPDKVG